MSEQAAETPVTDDTQGPSTSANDTGGEQDNSTQQESAPPWASFVEKFPEAYRGIAEEAAKEWDSGVTKRFQDLHSTYEPYKPFVEEWEPEAIGQALALAQALESDPQSFYESLARAYGFAEEQGAQEQQQVAPQAPGFDENDPYAPRLQQHEELLRTLADHILGQEEARTQAEQQAQEDQWFDQAMTALKSQYGEFDEQYVMHQIANGVDPDVAVQNFQSTVNSWAQKQIAPARQAPRVMGASGGLPSGQVDPASLNSRDTKDLVAEYLRKAQGG